MLVLSFDSQAALAEDPAQSAIREAVFVPDLLHPIPMRRVDVERTELAIVLAFAGATSGGRRRLCVDSGRRAGCR